MKSLHIACYLLPLIFFAAATCGLFYLVERTSVKPHHDVDSSAYLERAQLIATTGCCYQPGQASMPPSGSGYPYLLGLLERLAPGSTGVIVLLQLLMACASFFLMHAVATTLFGSTAGWWAWVLGCLNIGYLVFVQFILTEILLSLLLLWGLERLLRGRDGIGAIILGCSVMVKPAALYFILPLFLMRGWQQKTFPKLLLLFFIPRPSPTNGPCPSLHTR